MPELIVQLLNPIDEIIIQNLEKSLNNLTGFTSHISNNHTNIDSFFDKERQQYNAIKIIESFNSHKFDKSILITDVDIFIPIFTFVFGLAKLNGNTGIVSMHRLDSIFYGLPEDKKLLQSRLTKEIIHEFGHLMGLKHCELYKCVMTSSTVVEELDTKSGNYCNSCKNQIQNLSVF